MGKKYPSTDSLIINYIFFIIFFKCPVNVTIQSFFFLEEPLAPRDYFMKSGLLETVYRFICKVSF